jgi:hypothetical protein
VDPAIALDYYDIILDPIDLSLIRCRHGCGRYYASLEMLIADLRKMCDNCRYYNAPSSDYYQVWVGWVGDEVLTSPRPISVTHDHHPTIMTSVRPWHWWPTPTHPGRQQAAKLCRLLPRDHGARGWWRSKVTMGSWEARSLCVHFLHTPGNARAQPGAAVARCCCT